MGAKSKIKNYISTWEKRCYKSGIPDEAPLELEINNLVPSYRRIAIAIMKNDYQLQSLGFNREPCSAYNELKRIEISQRDVNKIRSIQLKLF